MHEITLSQRALEIIEQQALHAGARRVTGVWLKVGAFSCVEASALTRDSLMGLKKRLK